MGIVFTRTITHLLVGAILLVHYFIIKRVWLTRMSDLSWFVYIVRRGPTCHCSFSGMKGLWRLLIQHLDWLLVHCKSISQHIFPCYHDKFTSYHLHAWVERRNMKNQDTCQCILSIFSINLHVLEHNLCKCYNLNCRNTISH